MERKKIKGFEDYLIDIEGIVYGRNGEPLKIIERNKFSKVNLHRDGKVVTKRIDRLVWNTFNGRVRGILIHKDSNLSNNSLENLDDVQAEKKKVEGYTRKITGITLKKNGMYRARLSFQGKVYETTRVSESRAYEWYKQKCKELGITEKYLRR